MNKLTDEQYKQFKLKTSLGLIDKLYKQKVIDEITYNNIYKKYQSHLK